MDRCLALCLALTLWATPAAARDLGEQACATLAERVDAEAGSGPVFLRSWDNESGKGPPAEPALKGAAFTYDNALAAIALAACHRLPEARRVGEALLAAAAGDRSGESGRVRNAYRSGAQRALPPPPNGWWDAAANRWAEDPVQIGTATGNAAWAGLALLTLADATGEPRWREAAAAIGHYILNHAEPRKSAQGYAGGITGWDEAPQLAGWKSTEHNADLAALFHRLAEDDPAWKAPEASARAFLAAMWDKPAGRFFIGTLPDGATPNGAGSGLDAQLWPLLLPGAPNDWRRAVGWVEKVHGVPGGFDFNDDRDGLWVEGTLQAALVWRLLGRAQEADRLMANMAGQVSPGGYLWATREPVVTTGLALGPGSTTPDFVYRRRPALAATAWAALAGRGWNPYSGRPI